MNIFDGMLKMYLECSIYFMNTFFMTYYTEISCQNLPNSVCSSIENCYGDVY